MSSRVPAIWWGDVISRELIPAYAGMTYIEIASSPPVGGSSQGRYSMNFFRKHEKIGKILIIVSSIALIASAFLPLFAGGLSQ